MRTTLSVDDDVLQAAQEIARREKKTAGQVLSELARRALLGLAEGSHESPFLGFRSFPSRGEVVTNETVERLRDDGEY